MLPVLFSIGKFNVSSFGVFLALAFLFSVFLVWRLARAWDLDEEKILDLTLLTFLGGLIGARIYFGIEHQQFFVSNPFRIIFVNRYPGFSFWGGFLGGWLTLYFFVRRFKLDFWQIADIAAVGFLGGMILANLGCFLGGCGIGIQSKFFLAVPMVGVLGKRWPIQAIEAILLTFVLLKIWGQATHFHLRGKILSLTLILVGIIKLVLEPLRQVHLGGYLFSLTLIILGLTIFYRVSQRNLLTDLKALIMVIAKIITDRETRILLVLALKKSWYNQKTAFLWKIRNAVKLLRRFNVKISPKKSGNY